MGQDGLSWPSDHPVSERTKMKAMNCVPTPQTLCGYIYRTTPILSAMIAINDELQRNSSRCTEYGVRISDGVQGGVGSALSRGSL